MVSSGAGTLQRIATGFGAGAYRPSTRLAKRVRARDRRCRFPGCTVAAVFCDLDHVRPWPAGPTTLQNLICLCRRHHRIKQRPGWTVVLAADAVATWTDPTGRVRTSPPADALTCTVLTGLLDDGTPADLAAPAELAGTSREAGPAPAVSGSSPRLLIADGPHSELEFSLEHLGAVVPPSCRSTAWRDVHGRRQCTERSLARGLIIMEFDGDWPHYRARRPTRGSVGYRDQDPPPF